MINERSESEVLEITILSASIGAELLNTEDLILGNAFQFKVPLRIALKAGRDTLASRGKSESVKLLDMDTKTGAEILVSW